MSRTSAAAASRPGSEADEILGMRPAAVFAPADAAEAAAVVGDAAKNGLALGIAGGRTSIDLGAPPRRLDAVVETLRLSRILEHVPADQVVVAEAGVTLADLQRVLARHGQRLALDPPHPEVATLGGVVASNSFGPLRTRYGSVRDLLIGVSFVLADGTAARAGGKVVKNVAGFDVAKLLTGSLGTLALITTATFRLHPLPEESATILWEARSAADVAGLAGKLGSASLEPASVVVVAAKNDGSGGSGRWDVAVRFEGFRAGVAQQRDRLFGVLPGSALADAGSCREAAARHDAVREGAAVAVKVAAPRSAFPRVAAEAFAPLLAALDCPGAAWYPTLGLGFATGRPADPGSAVAAAPAIAGARTALAAMGGSLVVLSAPGAVRDAVDVWGPLPASFPWMRSVKERFDPDGRLAPGRFVGGL